MDLPEDLRYSREHEWVRVDGGRATVGVTDFAQDQLGDIVFAQLPDVGVAVVGGASLGELESTKSVSEVYSPVSGVVVEINGALDDSPDLVNSAPYGDGWLFAVEMSSPAEVDALLDATAYRAFVEEG